MSRKIKVTNNLEIEVEETRVLPYNRGGRQYAHIHKFVPREWVGKDVVIIRREDLDRLVKYVNNLLDTLSLILADENYKKQLVETIKKVKLSKKDFGF